MKSPQIYVFRENLYSVEARKQPSLQVLFHTTAHTPGKQGCMKVKEKMDHFILKFRLVLYSLLGVKHNNILIKTYQLYLN